MEGENSKSSGLNYAPPHLDAGSTSQVGGRWDGRQTSITGTVAATRSSPSTPHNSTLELGARRLDDRLPNFFAPVSTAALPSLLRLPRRTTVRQLSALLDVFRLAPTQLFDADVVIDPFLFDHAERSNS